MNIAKHRLDALEALGFTKVEAQFLYLVATHSGYFVARQFLGFAGVGWGKRTTVFWNKLKARRLARTYRFAQVGNVYHLFARKIYRQIGHEHPRNRRDHEFAHVMNRIAILDFVLGNLDNVYLETEADKVRFFCSERNVPSHALPSRTYAGRHTPKGTVRCFVDRFPMFFPPETVSSRNVTFTYIQGPEASLAGFVRHLQAYLPLFRELPQFDFLFLSRSEALFAHSAELFRGLVTIQLQVNPADDLLRYFAIRKAWDLAQYTSLTEDDLIFRNLAGERFHGPRFDYFYRSWIAGRIADAEIRKEFAGSDQPHAIQFSCRILHPIEAASRPHREAQ